MQQLTDFAFTTFQRLLCDDDYSIFETKEETHLSTPEIIKNYRFELVKVIESTGKTKNIKTQVHFKHTKFKCTKGKLKAKMVECSTF